MILMLLAIQMIMLQMMLLVIMAESLILLVIHIGEQIDYSASARLVIILLLKLLLLLKGTLTNISARWWLALAHMSAY